MDNKSFMHQSLQALHCPQCGSLYTNSEIGVLQESEANILATITCAKCQHQSVVTLSLGAGQAVGFVSDLKPAEISKFIELDSIDSDELIDIHSYLKKTKGNFAEDFRYLKTPARTKVLKS